MDEFNNRPEDPKNEKKDQGKDEFFAEPFVPQIQPAPVQAQRPNTFMTRWFPIILAVFMLVFGFFGGILYNTLARPEEAKVFEWMMKTIQKNSYFYNEKSESDVKKIMGQIGKMGVYYYTDSGDPTGDHYSDFLTPAEVQELIDEIAGSDLGVAVEWWQDYDKDGKVTTVEDDKGREYVASKNVYVSNVLRCVNETDYSAANQLQIFDRFAEVEIDGKFEDFWNKSYGDMAAAMNEYAAGKLYRAKVVRVVEQPDGSFDYPRTADGEIDPSKAVTVTLTNEKYEPNFVEYLGKDTTTQSLVFEDGKYVSKNVQPMSKTGMSDDTAYLNFKSFSGNAGKQFSAAMEKFKAEGKKNLILDLRYDGGGQLDILQDIASYLVTDENNSKSILLGTQKTRDGSTTKYKTSENRYSGMNFDKIVVLTNKNTASASEALIGAMDFYGTVDALVGTTSYGKGIMQSFFFYKQMEVSYALKLTTAKLFWPDNQTSIHGIGFVYDDPATGKTSNFKAENSLVAETLYSAADFSKDAQLAAAIEYINGK